MEEVGEEASIIMLLDLVPGVGLACPGKNMPCDVLSRRAWRGGVDGRVSLALGHGCVGGYHIIGCGMTPCHPVLHTGAR